MLLFVNVIRFIFRVLEKCAEKNIKNTKFFHILKLFVKIA